MTTLRVPARHGLALAALGAGAIHLAHGPEHLAAWAPLGAGFVAAGVLQLLWAVALLRRDSRPLLAAGAAGSLLFVGVWAVSRTTGLPLGPEAFERAPVGVADLTCALLELTVAAGALTLLRRPRLLEVEVGSRTRWAATGALAAVLLSSSGVALAAPAPEGHQHGERTQVEQVEHGYETAPETETETAHGHAPHG